MMPSDTTSTNQDHAHEDNVTSPSSVQLLQLTLCHEAAITLNNFIITTLLLRDRNVPAASRSFRDVIYLIKKCIIPPTASDAANGTTTYPTISVDDIHAMVHQAYQRAATVVTPMSGSFQPENDTTTRSDYHQGRVHVQVISNCLPCANVVTSRYNSSPTVRTVSSRTPLEEQEVSTLPPARPSNVSAIPSTSSRSTVSASSTDSSGVTTTSGNPSPASMEVLPSIVSSKGAATTVSVLPPPSSSEDMTVETIASTTASTDLNDNHDDRPTTMSIYPMTIDDYHTCSTYHDLMGMSNENNRSSDVRMLQYQQFVEYHAAIILYNFGVIHQCLGMTEDDPAMLDSEEVLNRPASSTSNDSAVVTLSTTSSNTSSVPMAIDDSGDQHMTDSQYDDRHDDVSPERLLASYKILTHTLSWIHELVRPIMDDVMNEGNDDDMSHTNNEMSTSATTPEDQYYMNKYLQVMVLINYHVLDIIDTLHFPDGPYEYHCTMMNEILNFIAYLEIFYPVTSSHNNNHTNNSIGSNVRGGASPAA